MHQRARAMKTYQLGMIMLADGNDLSPDIEKMQKRKPLLSHPAVQLELSKVGAAHLIVSTRAFEVCIAAFAKSNFIALNIKTITSIPHLRTFRVLRNSIHIANLIKSGTFASMASALLPIRTACDFLIR